jgi:hypothetical protein
LLAVERRAEKEWIRSAEHSGEYTEVEMADGASLWTDVSKTGLDRETP